MVTQTETKVNKSRTGIPGMTVIFNDVYIDEIVRHLEIARQKYEVEQLPEHKDKAKKILERWEQKLQWAEEFSDTVERFVDTEIPNITVAITTSGYELPVKNIQIV